MKMRPWNDFGTKLRPSRLQDALATSGLSVFGAFLEPFWLKAALEGAILGPSGDPQSVKNQTFGLRLVLGASKNDLWKIVWKKH